MFTRLVPTDVCYKSLHLACLPRVCQPKTKAHHLWTSGNMYKLCISALRRPTVPAPSLELPQLQPCSLHESRPLAPVSHTTGALHQCPIPLGRRSLTQDLQGRKSDTQSARAGTLADCPYRQGLAPKPIGYACRLGVGVDSIMQQ